MTDAHLPYFTIPWQSRRQGKSGSNPLAPLRADLRAVEGKIHFTLLPVKARQ
jgi:hypothetical protein